METLLSILSAILWWVLGTIWWVVVQLLWLLLWFALPLLVIAFVAFRVAGRVLGKPVVEAWLRRHAARLGAGTWRRTHRATLALLLLPPRVLLWLMLYGLWHSLVSLFWTPRWSPWQRAWGRRWVKRRTG